ncbi:MAG: hypothetical protein IIZ07_06260, partial [Ruminococcus sp.]|nr:hypothetical protein [Ruminococcus sp.]
DIHAAENRNVVKVNVTLKYQEVDYKSYIIWNGGGFGVGEAIEVYDRDIGSYRRLTPLVAGPHYYSDGGDYSPDDECKDPTVILIDVPVDFSYIKDFFNVKLHILNHASEDFSIVDSTVKLNVPNGLTIVDSNYSSSKSTVYLDEIKGQTQKTVSWVLRGDKPGEYNISADFMGILSYFNEPISAQFAPKEPIIVLDSSSLEITVEAATESYNGKIFYNTVVENKGDNAIEGFEWNPLIESFTDEFVDADGNHYEMEEQITTLKPGEKFIYHYYSEYDKMYAFYDREISDKHSNGAKVSVNVLPVNHFTDDYTEKYPMGTEDFVFHVKHNNHGIYEDVEGAEIRLNNNTVLTTDSNGKAVVPAEDRDKIKTNSVIVTKEGFYKYEHEFGGLQHNGNYTVIELHDDSEFEVEEVKLDGVSLITSNSTIAVNDVDLNGNPKAATFVAKIYGDVDKYDIYQNGNLINSVSKSAKAEKYLYAVVCSSNSFVVDQSVELRVKNKAGKEIVKPLNLKVIAPNPDANINIPNEKQSAEKDILEGSILNGFSLNFQLLDYLKFSWIYDKQERSYTYFIGVDAAIIDFVEKESQNGLDNFFETATHGKKWFKELQKEFRKQYLQAKGADVHSVKDALKNGKLSNASFNIFIPRQSNIIFIIRYRII